MWKSLNQGATRDRVQHAEYVAIVASGRKRIVIAEGRLYELLCYWMSILGLLSLQSSGEKFNEKCHKSNLELGGGVTKQTQTLEKSEESGKMRIRPPSFKGDVVF